MDLIYANKSALRAAVTSWMADGSLDSDTIDRAIALVESDMRRRLRVFQMEITQDLTISGETLVVPGRFLGARRLYIPGHRPMGYLSPELLVHHQFDRPEASAPTKFTLEGREDALPLFRFSPIPDTTYTLRLTFLADPALIDNDDCNAILDNWPDAYHYGALVHLGDHVRNKERLPDWQARYDAIMRDIMDADIKDKVDGSTITPRSVYRGA